VVKASQVKQNGLVFLWLLCHLSNTKKHGLNKKGFDMADEDDLEEKRRLLRNIQHQEQAMEYIMENVPGQLWRYFSGLKEVGFKEEYAFILTRDFYQMLTGRK
jgi:predicted AlkP superfamily pyrophosphatase or phosphodiesterase